MDNILNQKKLYQDAKKLGSHDASITRKLEYAILDMMKNPNKFYDIQSRKNGILRKSDHFNDVARKLFTD
jgi:hypothetical protein